MGWTLRDEHVRSQCAAWAASAGAQSDIREWVQRAWDAAVAGGWPRHCRADRAWELQEPGAFGAERRADCRGAAGGGGGSRLIRGSAATSSTAPPRSVKT